MLTTGCPFLRFQLASHSDSHSISGTELPSQSHNTDYAKGAPFATIPRMPIEQIVQQLRAERDRIDVAIRALRGVGQTSSGSQPKRHISAAGRARIAAAARARWASAKGQQNLVPIAQTSKAGKRTMSAAARRKIAASQRARWRRLKGA